MTAKDIQKEIIKSYIKPILKGNGYRLNGQTWWKDKGTFLIIINIQNFSWNNEDHIDFCFNSGLKFKVEMSEAEIKRPTPHHIIPYLREGFYLPEERITYKYRNTTGYTIRSSHFITEIIDELKIDFETYILPYLDKINSEKDALDKFGDIPFWGERLKEIIDNPPLSRVYNA